MDKLLKILETFELVGNSLLIEDLDKAPKEKTTDSGIVLVKTEAPKVVELHKGRVLKAGKGYTTEYGRFIPNKIASGAVIYYKNAAEYELEGIKFQGTEAGQVVAYKNPTNELGQPQ